MEKFEKTIENIANAIRGWEFYAGESFTDYFMDDTISDKVWYGFLIGKGFIEKAQEMEENLIAGKYIFQEKFEPFEYYNDNDFLEEEYYKNVLLWAELICGSNYYYNKFKEFIKEYFEQNES